MCGVECLCLLLEGDSLAQNKILSNTKGNDIKNWRLPWRSVCLDVEIQYITVYFKTWFPHAPACVGLHLHTRKCFVTIGQVFLPYLSAFGILRTNQKQSIKSWKNFPFFLWVCFKVTLNLVKCPLHKKVYRLI